MNFEYSAEARQNDIDCDIPLFPVDQIFADHDFNTRVDKIIPFDVINLAQNIAVHGLQQPIVIRPSGELEGDPTDYAYVIVCGHRRHQAYKVLKVKEIPAILKQGLSAEKYHNINAIENLNRKDLNILDEAKIIEFYVSKRRSYEYIANILNKSSAWVQQRKYLLSFPEDIQQDFKEGKLNTTHINRLYQLRKKPEEQYELVRKIKDAAAKNEKISISKVSGKKEKITSKRVRSKADIERLLDWLIDHYEPSLTTRALAWAAGNISNEDLFKDIREAYIEQEFMLPDFIK